MEPANLIQGDDITLKKEEIPLPLEEEASISEDGKESPPAQAQDEDQGPTSDEHALQKQKRGRKSKYEGAEHPELIDRAKLILPLHNYNLEKVLELEEFLPLRGSKDLTRFVSKFILNKTLQGHSKSVKEKSIKSIQINTDTFKNQKKEERIFKQAPEADTLPELQQELAPITVNQGAKTQSEITSVYIREFMTMNQINRQELLHRILQRNSQSLIEFLQQLKSACPENLYQNMFRAIYELCQQGGLSLQIKTRLFVQSLLYYNYESIEIEEALLKSSIQLLAYRPNTELALGLANYIFINEPDCLGRLEDDLLGLDRSNIGIIPLMIGTFQRFKVDSQIIKLLPNTLLSLNKGFIQMIKEDSGLRLIRDVPVNVVGDFISICALSISQSYQKLDNFIKVMSSIFAEKWDFLDQEDYSYFISQLALELKARSPLWIGKLDQISELSVNLALIQQEKGLRNRKDIIQDALKADFTKVNKFLNVPNKSSDLSNEDQRSIVKKFLKGNPEDERVISFCKAEPLSLFKRHSSLEQIEQLLGFNLLALQRFCVNFLLNNEDRSLFLNFGIGNGKTLLCSVYAMLLAIKQQGPIFVIGKNDHLVLRDHKNFEPLIRKLGLNTNLSNYSSKAGVYYLCETFLLARKEDEEFGRIIQSSTLILDEYDWIMFDGLPQDLVEMHKELRKAKRLVGFTGSTLSQKEDSLLEVIYEDNEIVFPRLSSIIGERRIQLNAEVITTSQLDFQKRAFQLAFQHCRLTPVIIVAQKNYWTIDCYFRKFTQFPYQALMKIRGMRFEAIFDESFAQKNAEGKYGVYLLTEKQGRGTDFKTSQEIEFNGGLCLIIADIFSE